ncbi:hypothetical protein SDC9_196218 [bioreactor metagenome]|uniref:Uncharacterized protein n=1 Tax=bioreactor metagenome TaxID=1076179 RepID=A0A645IBE9_9ZZZZ
MTDDSFASCCFKSAENSLSGVHDAVPKRLNGGIESFSKRFRPVCEEDAPGQGRIHFAHFLPDLFRREGEDRGHHLRYGPEHLPHYGADRAAAVIMFAVCVELVLAHVYVE